MVSGDPSPKKLFFSGRTNGPSERANTWQDKHILTHPHTQKNDARKNKDEVALL
jgi:hypothetical protein